MDLVENVYRLTDSWPDSERYGLVAQCRRAALSIPANLAEGVGRGSRAERARFGQIALGSLYELATLLELAHRLRFIDAAAFQQADRQLALLARRLNAYLEHWRLK